DVVVLRPAEPHRTHVRGAAVAGRDGSAWPRARARASARDAGRGVTGRGAAGGEQRPDLLGEGRRLQLLNERLVLFRSVASGCSSLDLRARLIQDVMVVMPKG